MLSFDHSYRPPDHIGQRFRVGQTGLIGVVLMFEWLVKLLITLPTGETLAASARRDVITGR